NAAARKSGMPLEIDYRVRRHDGAYRWHFWRAIPIKSPEGRIIQWVGTTTDIDDRKQIELELRASEQRYRALTGTLPSIVMMAERDGRLTYFNERWYEYTGIAPTASPDGSWLDVIHPEDREGVASTWREGVATRQPVTREYRLRRHDGTYRWHFGRAEPIVGADDEITGWISSITDIEDIKRAQDVAHESETRYRSLSEAMPALIVTMDGSGRYEYANGAYLAYTGLTLEQANDWQGEALIHPEDEEQATAVWVRALELVEPFQNEFRLRRHDGRYRWHLVSAVPVRAEAGVPVRWITVSVDIEDRRQAEDALTESEAALEDQRNQLQVITDTTAALISYVDSDLRYRFANGKYREWFGLDPQSIVGWRTAEVFGEDAFARLQPHAERALSGETAVFEEYVPYARGGGRWVSGTYQPDIGPDGVRGYFALTIDIGERKREEMSKQLLADVAEALTASLDYDSTITAVARCAVPRFADSVLVYLREDDGAVTRITTGHDGWHLLVKNPYTIEGRGGVPVTDALEQRRTTLLATIAAGETHPNVLDGDDSGEALPLRSAIVVPLSLRGTSLGAIAFCLVESERHYDDADLQTAEEISRRAAMAIENARLYREARRANEASGEALRDAEAANEKLRFLSEASALISESLEHEQTMQRLARLAVSYLADWCAIDLKTPDGFMRLAFAGADQGLVHEAEGLRERYPVDPEGPHGSPYVMRTGRREYIPDITETLLREVSPDDDVLDAIRRFRLRSSLCEPLIARGRLLGTMSFATEGERVLTPADVELAAEFTRRAAIALDNSQLYQDARRALEEREEALILAETANANLRFLAEARGILSEALDFDQAMDKLLQTLVPRLADYASLVVCRPGGDLERLAHRWASEEWREHAEQPMSFNPEAAWGIPGVLRSRKPELMSVIPERLYFELWPDGETRQVARTSPMRSYVIVPMHFSDGTDVVLSLVSSTPGRYREDDLELLQDFAHRAAVALDNARLFSELREAAEELRRANAAKDEFLGLVSHELKTPITTIMGNAEVLFRRSDALDAESRAGALADIRNDAERLHRIIENLLVLARLERGQQFEREPLLVHRLAERLANEHRRRFPRRTIQVHAETDAGAALAETGYAELVLRNLMSNAEKYSPAHEPIDIFIERRGREIVVRVLDRGIGFAPEEAEELFTPFYRSTSVPMNVQGIGIGLAVCKRLIEVQNGRVWAAPREGGGSEVGFALPAIDEADVAASLRK
ncbi:MAG TPA: PAS domain S-box protein, partial [Dehalococcoidia bacterium]|nr:PAS domain S-box protein [Dehalococcoidia bacterium]